MSSEDKSIPRSSIRFKVISIPIECNAFQIIKEKFGKTDVLDKCVDVLDVKEAITHRYKLTLIGLNDPKYPNDFVACVNNKVVCVVELPSDLPFTNDFKEVVETTLSQVLSINNGMCLKCSYKGKDDCYRENFEKLIVEKEEDYNKNQILVNV